MGPSTEHHAAGNMRELRAVTSCLRGVMFAETISPRLFNISIILSVFSTLDIFMTMLVKFGLNLLESFGKSI